MCLQRVTITRGEDCATYTCNPSRGLAGLNIEITAVIVHKSRNTGTYRVAESYPKSCKGNLIPFALLLTRYLALNYPARKFARYTPRAAILISTSRSRNTPTGSKTGIFRKSMPAENYTRQKGNV